MARVPLGEILNYDNIKADTSEPLLKQVAQLKRRLAQSEEEKKGISEQYETKLLKSTQELDEAWKVAKEVTAERDMLLKELQSANLRLQAMEAEAEAEAEESASTTDRAVTEENLKKANETVIQMDIHYRREVGRATEIIRRYQEQLSAVSKENARNGTVVQELTARLNGALGASAKGDSVMVYTLRENYTTLLGKYDLLKRGYASLLEQHGQLCSDMVQLTGQNPLERTEQALEATTNHLSEARKDIETLKAQLLAKDALLREKLQLPGNQKVKITYDTSL